MRLSRPRVLCTVAFAVRTGPEDGTVRFRSMETGGEADSRPAASQPDAYPYRKDGRKPRVAISAGVRKSLRRLDRCCWLRLNRGF